RKPTCKDNSKITIEQVINDILFNSVRHSNGTPTTLEKYCGPEHGAGWA
ncbi:hypothetical protein IFM89_007099, partial [Coptis chinensis]